MTTLAPPISSHGGIIFQLDMFRPSMMAAVLAEGLVSKARNILTSSLEIARHPSAPIAVARIIGSVVGDDPAEFWRDNADIAAYASQVLPRQAFVYYARGGENRREGFMVVQRGQIVMANDATVDSIPPGTPWPVTRLCEQMRVSLDDLADAFPGGPRVTISLAEPQGDDQRMLMILAGQPDDADPDAPLDDEADAPPPPPEPQRQARQAPSHAPAGGASPAGRAGRPAGPSIEEDSKRRAAERAAELEAQQARAAAATRGLAHVVDERGLVVAPPVELGEAEILARYHLASVEGNLPEGVPERLRSAIQGKPIDFAVRVEFLSEVFFHNRPLNRADFDANAAALRLGDRDVRVMEVFAPRLGAGTLVRAGSANVFVSRRLGEPLPAGLVLELLAR